MTIRFARLVLPVFIFALAGFSVMAEETRDPVGDDASRLFSSRTFFTGGDFEVVIRNVPGSDRIPWALVYLRKTLLAGTVVPDAGGTVRIKGTFPQTAEGLFADAEITLRIGDEKRISQILHFFPKSPFVGETEFLEKRNIGVWDGDPEQTLSNALKELHVPFHKPDDFSTFTGDILLVSGINLSDWPNFPEILKEQGKRSVRILVLCPQSGSFPIENASISQIFLAGTDAIAAFDTRFDTWSWDNRPFIERTFRFGAEDGTVSLVFVESDRHFSYCEFRVGQAEVILTTWRIAEHLGRSPTAVHLLHAMMLEQTFDYRASEKKK
jgi:hypothetical protein